MEFPEFVWSTADIIISSADYLEKIKKCLDLIAAECHAESKIIWIPDEEDNLHAEYSDIENPKPFIHVAVNSYDNNSASVARIEGLYVMTLPVWEDESFCICVQLLGTTQFVREDLNFLIESGDILSKILRDFRPKSIVDRKGGEPVISVKGLRKSYLTSKNKTEVLHGIDFDVFENEIVVILGASGTGKTTLLNILGGLDRADEGSVVVDSKDICRMSNEDLRKFRRYNIGFVFQFNNLLPNLTALENIKYGAELASKKTLPMKVLETVKMESLADKYPSQMSPGQQQIISIARILIKKSKIILADEPTGSLDLESGRNVLGVFENITENKLGTVIIMTHNAEVAKIANRVIKLEQGKISSITNNLYKMKAEELVW